MSNPELQRRDAIHHIRVNRFVGLEAERLETSIATFEESQLPGLRDLPGFRTFFFGQNPRRGIAAGVTFWESEQALRCGETREAAARKYAVTAAGGSLAQGMVDRYRIIFEHHRDPAREPVFARLVYWHGAWPSHISDTVAAFTEEQVPLLDQMEGYDGLVIGANFQLGSAVSIMLWCSVAAFEDSLEWEHAARRTLKTGGLSPRKLFADNYEVVFAPELRQLQNWPAWDGPGTTTVSSRHSHAGV